MKRRLCKGKRWARRWLELGQVDDGLCVRSGLRRRRRARSWRDMGLYAEARIAFFKCFKIGIVTILEDESDNRDKDIGSSKAFELLSDRIHNGAMNWSSALSTACEFTLTEYYWEWLEDVLSRNTQVLKSTGLYNAVFASLFSYDRHAPVIRAFC
ncbi:hypothetical protein L3X38_026726 [Prunus dulcis]|uniref:Uncharacterized protein n=1 Tax=Prunus dulcis TaxID=3755 RepID=A0AAD4VLJ4_PRUDU|nr:hypothetical protein L3X38_026726 [Prunus dulcis]